MPSSDPADFLKHFGTEGLLKSASRVRANEPDDVSGFGRRNGRMVVRKEESDEADFLKHFGTRGLRQSSPHIRKPVADEYVEHFGVKGMHWGDRHTRSQAESDANEHIKAKLFYGEGAGTRRKLIKAKVTERSKNPAYKKAFDEAVAKQDLDKAAAQATRTRRRKDTTKFVGKTTRGVHRSLTGGFGSVTVTAAAVAAGATYLHSSGLDKVILKKAASVVNNPTSTAATKAWLKSQGIG